MKVDCWQMFAKKRFCIFWSWYPLSQHCLTNIITRHKILTMADDKATSPTKEEEQVREEIEAEKIANILFLGMR